LALHAEARGNTWRYSLDHTQFHLLSRGNAFRCQVYAKFLRKLLLAAWQMLPTPKPECDPFMRKTVLRCPIAKV